MPRNAGRERMRVNRMIVSIMERNIAVSASLNSMFRIPIKNAGMKRRKTALIVIIGKMLVSVVWRIAVLIIVAPTVV